MQRKAVACTLPVSFVFWRPLVELSNGLFKTGMPCLTRFYGPFEMYTKGWGLKWGPFLFETPSHVGALARPQGLIIGNQLKLIPLSTGPWVWGFSISGFANLCKVPLPCLTSTDAEELCAHRAAPEGTW